MRHLVEQLQAGADAVQIFDTWAGILPPAEFERWCVEPARQIVDAGPPASSRREDSSDFRAAPAARSRRYVDRVPVDAVSIDWTAEPAFIRERIQSRVAVQGNLDPLALLAGGAALDRAVDDVLANFGSGPADLQSRPRHSAGDADRACRADAAPGAPARR